MPEVLARPLPKVGDFIRVREDHEDPTRAGRDGMVMQVDGDSVALYFGADRCGRSQSAFCAGPETWALSELDLASLDTSTL